VIGDTTELKKTLDETNKVFEGGKHVQCKSFNMQCLAQPSEIRLVKPGVGRKSTFGITEFLLLHFLP